MTMGNLAKRLVQSSLRVVLVLVLLDLAWSLWFWGEDIREVTGVENGSKS